MANINVAIFNYSTDGDKHIFSYKDGSLIENIEGTISEIAYIIFDKCIVRNNIQNAAGCSSWPPFDVETTALGQSTIKTDLLCDILPEPDETFWDELNKYFQRYLDLRAFS